MRVAQVLADMRALPIVDLDAIMGDGAAIILAPHPDDESLGCAGLIAEACDRRRPPFVVFVTDGAGSHPGSRMFPPARLRATRESEAVAALRELGLPRDHIAFLRVPDAGAPHEGPSFEKLVGTIAEMARQRKCERIFASWQNDPHCDHLAAHLMAVAVARRSGIPHWSYPVWGWTLPGSAPMQANVRGARLDIHAWLPAKRRAIAAHVSQHGGLITDDPNGFSLPAAMLSVFDEPYEVFLKNDDT